MSDIAKKLVERTIERYPLSFEYKGKLSEEDIEYIELFCDIKSSSVYMDGSCCYSIRRNRNIENETILMNDVRHIDEILKENER